MKFRRLPLEERLEAIAVDQGEAEMVRIRNAEFLSTVKTAGFQLVTGVLRGLEQSIYRGLLEDPARPEHKIGALQAIAAIRQSLTALLPDDQRLSVDWFDDQDEEFNLDPSTPTPVNEDAE